MGMTTKDELEIFLHGAEKPKVVTAEGSDVLHDVLVAAGVVNKDDKEKLFVFVGECDESLKHPNDEEDGEDDHKPVEVHLTLEVLDLHKHRHIHVHRCKRVAVEVNFGGKTKKHKFSPAATVGTVTEWARRKFHLDPASAAEYVLQIRGTHDVPRSDVHLGELVKKNECSLCFDLVKEVTPQG
jgi:hypothetical protein